MPETIRLDPLRLPELIPVPAHPLYPAIDTEGRITKSSRISAAIFVLILPTIATAWAIYHACVHGFSGMALWILLGMYLACGFGVTVGYHRLFTHRSFQTYPSIRYLLAVLGGMAAEGAPIVWSAQHRQHHASSDEVGDPHSPVVGRKPGFIGAIKAFVHAHYGHVFNQLQPISVERFAPDLAEEKFLCWLERFAALPVLLGFIIPAAIGYSITRTWHGAWEGLLWGGFVRLFAITHATGAVNSVCHMFGTKPFKTGDDSRNNIFLVPITMGESWHAGHHAFPTSAKHGLRWWEIDPSWMLIWLMEKAGLASAVIRIPADRIKDKLL